MWKVLGGWYSRRVVNVNVNIVTAAVLALLPTLIAVHAVEIWLLVPNTDPLSSRLATRHKLVISVVTFLVDVISDFFIYYALHFMANHWPKALKYRPHDAQHTHVPFLKDATLVQFQRMILSPLLYAIWIGSQQFLMHAFDVSSVWATGIGCVAAVATIRCIHTFWMIKAEAKKRLAQGAKVLHDVVTHSRLHLHAPTPPPHPTDAPPPPPPGSHEKSSYDAAPGGNGAPAKPATDAARRQA